MLLIKKAALTMPPSGSHWSILFGKGSRGVDLQRSLETPGPYDHQMTSYMVHSKGVTGLGSPKSSYYGLTSATLGTGMWGV